MWKMRHGGCPTCSVPMTTPCKAAPCELPPDCLITSDSHTRAAEFNPRQCFFLQLTRSVLQGKKGLFEIVMFGLLEQRVVSFPPPKHWGDGRVLFPILYCTLLLSNIIWNAFWFCSGGYICFHWCWVQCA